MNFLFKIPLDKGFCLCLRLSIVMKLSAQGIRNSINKGFTLIELLVVIGILGILAAALVATIDPFEQLNKANDSNAKNVGVEFLNSTIRYYTTHSALPWDDTTAGGADCLTGTTDLSAINLSTMTANCLSTLISEGELKQGFTTATGIISQIVANETTNNLTVCYLPRSKSQQKDANTKFAADGTVTTGCKSQGGATNCYWCTQ